jgi:hypothetical protein
MLCLILELGNFIVAHGTMTPVGSTSSDGRLGKESATSYSAAQSATVADYLYDATTYMIIGQSYSFPGVDNWWEHRSYIPFDTSFLGTDAVISSAILSFKGYFDASAADFNITIQNGQPTYPHIPLITSDFNKNYYSGNGGTFNTSNFAVGNYMNITLNADGISWISKTGITKFCLRSSKDISATAPSGDEFVEIYSYEAGASSQPKLYLTYTRVPVNNQLSLTNPSIGTQGCLAAKQYYIFQAKVTDEDGPTTLNYVDLTLDRTGQNLKVRWTESTQTFSEVNDPNNYITVSGTSSSSGNQWTINFRITFVWTYPDESTHACRLFSLDDDGFNDTNDYSAIYYVENDLVSSSLTVNDYRVNPGQTLTMSGYWYYQGTTIYPPDGDYQVKIKWSGSQKGSIDTTLVNGYFSISDVSAETTVSTYSYTVEASHMASAGTFSTVIVDRFEFVSITVSDSRINTGGTFQLRYKIRYDYDNVEFDIHKGSVTGFTWQSHFSYWEKTVTGSSSVTITNYDETYITISDVTYGITAKQDVAGVNVITDRIKVMSYSVSNSHANIQDNITIDATLKYEYDAVSVTTGTITINGYSATHQGSGVYQITKNSMTTGSAIFDAVAGSESTYGLAIVNQNGQSATVVWDRVLVTINANTTSPDADKDIESEITAKYEYDNSPLTSWSININRNETHFATGNFTDNNTQNTRYLYTTENITDDTYGLTTFYSNTLTVQWGNLFIECYQISANKTRTGTGQNVLLSYRLRYSGNQSDVTGGSLCVNGTAHTIDADGYCNFTATYSNVKKAIFSITAVNVTGEIDYGQLPANPEIIFDKLTVTFSASTTQPHVGDNVQITWTITRQYDQTAVTDYSIDIAVNGVLKWSNLTTNTVSDSAATSMTKTYNVYAHTVKDNTYNITAWSSSGIAVSWSSITPPVTPTTSYALVVFTKSALGEPVQSVVVDIYVENTLITSGRTGLDGIFTANLSPGTYTIIVHLDGSTLPPENITLTQDTPLEFTIPSTQPSVAANFTQILILLSIVIVGMAAIPALLKRRRK